MNIINLVNGKGFYYTVKEDAAEQVGGMVKGTAVITCYYQEKIEPGDKVYAEYGDYIVVEVLENRDAKGNFKTKAETKNAFWKLSCTFERAIKKG